MMKIALPLFIFENCRIDWSKLTTLNEYHVCLWSLFLIEHDYTVFIKRSLLIKISENDFKIVQVGNMRGDFMLLQCVDCILVMNVKIQLCRLQK